MEQLKKYVINNKCNLGIAYDGDGDRCLAIDENGNEIDGDVILAVVSKYLKEKDKLANNTVVATIMSNLGLNKFAEENNIEIKQTKVGDRYVLEEMIKNDYNIGGEQSGHVIMLDYNPTGDGILTSLMLLQIMLEKDMPASQLCSIIRKYPQAMINVSIKNDKKSLLTEDKEIKTQINKITQLLGNDGRIVVRPSGTEPLIRVMIEGQKQNEIDTYATQIADLIKNKLN